MRGGFFESHPRRVVQELEDIATDLRFKNGEEDGERVYRDCYTTCTAFQEFTTYRDFGAEGCKERLAENCRECTLRPGPGPEALMISRQSWLRMERLPADAPLWLVRGVAHLDAQRRIF